jgi:hypothetical protein
MADCCAGLLQKIGIFLLHYCYWWSALSHLQRNEDSSSKIRPYNIVIIVICDDAPRLDLGGTIEDL